MIFGKIVGTVVSTQIDKEIKGKNYLKKIMQKKII